MMKKILIVDDEPWIRQGIREQIDCETLGVQIIGEAGNGRLAIEVIKNDLPDIVLTDVRMPVMDGIELVEYIHRNDLRIKTVIISGYSEFDYAKKAIDYDVFSYLLKPIDDEELNNTIRQIVSKLDEEQQMGIIEYEYPNSRIKNFIYCIENLYKDEVFDEIDYLFQDIGSIVLRNTIERNRFAVDRFTITF